MLALLAPAGQLKLLLLEGIVSEKEHRRLRDWTLDCIERQHARFLSRFRRSLNHHSSQTEQITGRTVAGQPSPAAVQPPGADLDPAARGSPTRADQGARVATRLDQAEQQSKQGRVGPDPDLPVIWAEENRQGKPEVKPELARRLVTSTEQMRAVSAPRFRVPGWIKSAGEEMGRVISGYRIFGKVGEGGMGTVWEARQRSLERDVAVKGIKRELDGPIGRAQLLREARVTGALEHPNIIPVHALVRGTTSAGAAQDGAPLMVMKRVEGTAWSDRMDATRGQPDFLEQQLRILMQVCHAVHFAHTRGVLHRDLKPENVMLGGFGEVYVLDWGIALALHDQTGIPGLPLARDARGVIGTIQYMAPEMVAGGPEAATFKSDIYGLGATLYRMLTGFPPRNLQPELLPPQARELVMRCLSKDPAQRPESARALAEELKGVGSAVVRAEQSGPSTRGGTALRSATAADIPEVDGLPDLDSLPDFGPPESGHSTPPNFPTGLPPCLANKSLPRVLDKAATDGKSEATFTRPWAIAPTTLSYSSW